jgi:hypothetical protein
MSLEEKKCYLLENENLLKVKVNWNPIIVPSRSGVPCLGGFDSTKAFMHRFVFL